MVRAQFGQDSEIFAIGFSLGSNHLLKYLGTHNDCQVRAAMSVSGAFDVLATGLDLKTETYGIYDNYILGKIKEPFQ